MKTFFILIITTTLSYGQNLHQQSFGLKGNVKSVLETSHLSNLYGIEVKVYNYYEFDSVGRVTSSFNSTDSSSTKYHYINDTISKAIFYKKDSSASSVNYTVIGPNLYKLQHFKNNKPTSISYIEVDSLDRIIKISVPEEDYVELYKYSDDSIFEERTIIGKGDTLITINNIEILEFDAHGNWTKYEASTNQAFPISKYLVEREIKY